MIKKPLIAKWKVGSQKLQVASINNNINIINNHNNNNINSRSQNDGE